MGIKLVVTDEMARAARDAYNGGNPSWEEIGLSGRERWRAVAAAVLAPLERDLNGNIGQVYLALSSRVEADGAALIFSLGEPPELTMRYEAGGR